MAQTGTLNASGKLETLPNLDKAVRDGELSGPKLNELAAAVGARIEAALDAETDVVFKEARAQGRNEPLAAYRADALERLVCGGGAKVDATVVIRVDESRLRGEEGMCESPSTGPLPASEAIGAILAGAFVRIVVHDGTDIATVSQLELDPAAVEREAPLA